MPAEPKLVEYEYRVAEDILEEADVVTFGKMSTKFKAKIMTDNDTESTNQKTSEHDGHQLGLGSFDSSEQHLEDKLSEKSLLSSSYEKMINIYGRFQQETLELRLTPLK
jgi:hypothetical protein